VKLAAFLATVLLPISPILFLLVLYLHRLIPDVALGIAVLAYIEFIVPAVMGCIEDLYRWLEERL